MSENLEQRTYAVPDLRIAGDSKTITGHAAVFNRRSLPLWGFVEQIAPGAFADVLTQDVRALWNHDSNVVLGRTSSGTLRMHEDDQGLAVAIDLPNTTAARDLAVSIGRRDVDQMSFGFVVGENGDEWTEERGEAVRTIKRVDRLLDVSPVTFPAYESTDAALRSLERFRDQVRHYPKLSERFRQLQVMQMSL